jgi:hypothetical protein
MLNKTVAVNGSVILRKLIYIIAMFIILCTAKVSYATNTQMAPLEFPEGVFSLGIHTEYGNTVYYRSDEDREIPLATGIALQATGRLPHLLGLSLLCDISYESFHNCFRGRYGLELFLENDLFVRLSRTEFAIAVKGGGINRFWHRYEMGVFYGIGLYFPVLSRRGRYGFKSHPFVYYFGVEGNHYFEHKRTESIDVVVSARILYRIPGL